jgi:hypothetical protein
VLDPYPERKGQGVVADGRVRVLADDMEIGARELSGTPIVGRWDDLDLLEYTACSLWSWVALPVMWDLPPGRHEVTVQARTHTIMVNGDRAVTRHDEGGVIHHLSGHCDFGGVLVATRRRTRNRHGVPLAWADLVAAHVIPTKALN